MTVRLFITTANTNFYSALQAFLPALAAETGHDLVLVGSAGDMMTAKKKIAATLPDLVICDLGQADGAIDGLAMARWAEQLRSSCSQLSPQVALCSLYDDGIFQEASREAGACAFLVKDNLSTQLPFIFRQLFPRSAFQSTTTVALSA